MPVHHVRSIVPPSGIRAGWVMAIRQPKLPSQFRKGRGQALGLDVQPTSHLASPLHRFPVTFRDEALA